MQKYGWFYFIIRCRYEIEINDKKQLFNLLNKNSYYTILQGNNDFMYENIRLIPNECLLLNKTMYIGVTHEYLSIPKNYTELKLEKNVIFIQDIGDGGSKQDNLRRY